ncbi:PTS sugar transporter subunit IIA [Alkalibacillus aidingensis]|uniref:PTS sugar transporter subunit IIA n=1 Tax=Alkalibacillus aidingensis TaxID=2747607 RepID=UPI00166185A7|nr:PTS sugar transporter subunit IIA [Alkalibacillus aidingensis]
MGEKLLSQSAIRSRVSVGDWEEAVRVCGQLLVDEGYVESSYVEAMINNINELGPYMIIAPGVALPHARPEDGVIQEGISVVVLQDSVEFDSGKDVNVLIGLAAKNKESHIELLQKIAKVISQEETLHQLKQATTTADVLQVFKI